MSKRNNKVPELSHLAEGAAQRTIKGQHPYWWDMTPQERLEQIHEAKKLLNNRNVSVESTIADKIKQTLGRWI